MTMTMIRSSGSLTGPHGSPLPLREFLTLTAATPVSALRRALAAALSVETPNTPHAYGRFYGRVLKHLGVLHGVDVHRERQRRAWPCTV